MFKSHIKPQYFVIPLILIVITLTAFSAKADQIFSYSNDLSSNYNLDMSQTGVKLVGGMAYTADDSVSSAIVSNVVANPTLIVNQNNIYNSSGFNANNVF